MSKTKIVITSLVMVLSLGGLAHAKNDKGKSLPPGLQMNQQRGKSLPPGWEKKLAVGDKLDKDVYDQGKVVLVDDKKGLITISVEGKLIKLMQDTKEIVDILDDL
jgi:NADH dehydrogenase FAD-containing subunit